MKRKDVEEFKRSGKWRKLEQDAVSVFDELKKNHGDSFDLNNGSFAMGGGTRLMLELDHRISDDIDIFLNDKQLLSYFEPDKNDRICEISDGNDPDVHNELVRVKNSNGEIDFIVGPRLLTGLDLVKSVNSPFLLEAIPEVLAKKLFHRGQYLQERDLFDWWVIGNRTDCLNEDVSEMLALLLENKIEEIAKSLTLLSQKDLAGKTEKWDNIKAWDVPTMSEAILYAHSYLDKLVSINSAKNKAVIKPKFG